MVMNCPANQFQDQGERHTQWCFLLRYGFFKEFALAKWPFIIKSPSTGWYWSWLRTDIHRHLCTKYQMCMCGRVNLYIHLKGHMHDLCCHLFTHIIKKRVTISAQCWSNTCTQCMIFASAKCSSVLPPWHLNDFGIKNTEMRTSFWSLCSHTSHQIHWT